MKLLSSLLVLSVLLVVPVAFADGPIEIIITDSGFSSKQITIDLSDTVSWKNTDTEYHTVTSDDWGYGSGLIPSGSEYYWNPETAGTFQYYDKENPTNTGTIIVKEDDTTMHGECIDENERLFDGICRPLNFKIQSNIEAKVSNQQDIEVLEKEIT